MLHTKIQLNTKNRAYKFIKLGGSVSIFTHSYDKENETFMDKRSALDTRF